MGILPYFDVLILSRLILFLWTGNVLQIKRLGGFDERFAFRRRISIVMQHQRRAVKIGGDARLAFKKAVLKTECLVALHQCLARFECGFQELVKTRGLIIQR